MVVLRLPRPCIHTEKDTDVPKSRFNIPVWWYLAQAFLPLRWFCLSSVSSGSRRWAMMLRDPQGSIALQNIAGLIFGLWMRKTAMFPSMALLSQDNDQWGIEQNLKSQAQFLKHLMPFPDYRLALQFNYIFLLSFLITHIVFISFWSFFFAHVHFVRAKLGLWQLGYRVCFPSICCNRLLKYFNKIMRQEQ